MEICLHSLLQIILDITLLMCLAFMQDRFLEKESLAQRLCTFYMLIGSTELPSSGVQFRLPPTANENSFPHQK